MEPEDSPIAPRRVMLVIKGTESACQMVVDQLWAYRREPEILEKRGNADHNEFVVSVDNPPEADYDGLREQYRVEISRTEAETG